jgi:hypothetical protein
MSVLCGVAPRWPVSPECFPDLSRTAEFCVLSPSNTDRTAEPVGPYGRLMVLFEGATGGTAKYAFESIELLLSEVASESRLRPIRSLIMDTSSSLCTAGELKQ